MANEGVVAKGVAKRAAIVDAALEVFATSGYRSMSLREVAERTGLTQGGLLHHFGSRENLLTEVLRRKEERARGRRTEPIGTPEALVAALRDNTRTPGLVELHSVLATQAADPEHPAHDYFEARYVRMRGRLADDVRRRQAAGTVIAAADPEMVATSLLALADGLQVQWMLDGSIAMPEHLAHMWSLLQVPRS